jgi:hypothetical protein
MGKISRLQTKRQDAMASKTNGSSKDEPANTRWWESYLVRYFLGFIVGTVCVVVILAKVFPNQAPDLLGQTANLFTKPAVNSSNVEKGAKCEQLVVVSQASTTTYVLQAQSERKNEFSTASAIGIALLGLAFCYIASTPITVIHAGRMYRTWFERQTRTFWFGWCITIAVFAMYSSVEHSTWKVVFALLVGFSLILLSDPFYHSHKMKELSVQATEKQQYTMPTLWQVYNLSNAEVDRSRAEKPPGRVIRTQLGFLVNSLGWFSLLFGVCLALASVIGLNDSFGISISAIALALPALWICIVQYNCLLQILTKPETFHHWYRKIAKARQEPGAKEIRESYTHLREHANSVFIVVIEVSILALLLVFWQVSGRSIPQTQNNFEFHYLAAAFFGIWLVPTIFMWSRANWLEQEFAERPNDFTN